jgi:hypothetical protein
MANGENMVLKRMANEFRIWRVANSVNWDCTASELAEDLSLRPETVRRICAQKGWELPDDRGRSRERLPVDRMIKS